jgi:hypothetical protein
MSGRLSMVDEMPEWSRADLEAECMRQLGRDPATRVIKSVTIGRLNPEGSGPNWTIFGAVAEPPLTGYGWQRAREIVAGIAGTYALAPGEL